MKKNRASRAKAWALFCCLLLAIFGPNLLGRLSRKVNHLEDDFLGCSNTVIEEVVSPGGSYVATEFERACGATTDFAPHAILKPAAEKFKESDYIDDVDDVVYSEVRRTGAIKFKWQTNSHLFIYVSEKAKESLVQETRWQDVRVSFR